MEIHHLIKLSPKTEIRVFCARLLATVAERLTIWIIAYLPFFYSKPASVLYFLVSRVIQIPQNWSDYGKLPAC